MARMLVLLAPPPVAVEGTRQQAPLPLPTEPAADVLQAVEPLLQMAMPQAHEELLLALGAEQAAAAVQMAAAPLALGTCSRGRWTALPPQLMPVAVKVAAAAVVAAVGSLAQDSSAPSPAGRGGAGGVVAGAGQAAAAEAVAAGAALADGPVATTAVPAGPPPGQVQQRQSLSLCPQEAAGLAAAIASRGQKGSWLPPNLATYLVRLLSGGPAVLATLRAEALLAALDCLALPRSDPDARLALDQLGGHVPPLSDAAVLSIAARLEPATKHFFPSVVLPLSRAGASKTALRLLLANVHARKELGAFPPATLLAVLHTVIASGARVSVGRAASATATAKAAEQRGGLQMASMYLVPCTCLHPKAGLVISAAWSLTAACTRQCCGTRLANCEPRYCHSPRRQRIQTGFGNT